MTITDAGPSLDSAAVRPCARSARIGARLGWRAPVAALVLGAVALVAAACTPQQIAEAAVNKWFGSSLSTCALKIVKSESNYDASALSSDGKNIGLFQINSVHSTWIKSTYGYTFSQLTDPDKNSQVAKGLSDSALSYYGDRWQPWRLDGKARTDGSCPR